VILAERKPSGCKPFVNRSRRFLHETDWSPPRCVPTLLHVGAIDARACEEVTEVALINRMSRLITADFHAVLDRLEEPEALLRQAIREMEEELARNERKVTGLEHEQEGLIARREKLDATLRELDTELDLSFDSGNEALARRLIKRKLETT